MLSLNQKKILKLLAINSRYSNKDIAKSVGMSEDTVHYQIKNFLEKQKLISFVNSFNFKEMGFDQHHYLLRLKNLQNLPIDKLIQIPEIFFINTSSGRYDLQLIFCHRDDEEFIQIKSKIDELLLGNIAESIILKYYSSYKFTNILPIFDVAVSLPRNQKNPLYALNKSDWHSSNAPLWPVAEFTKGELATLSFLLKNARSSYAEIGRKTGQSYETVRQQIIKFVDKKYIGNFGIFTNFEAFGYYSNYILLNTESLNDMRFGEYVKNNKNIFFAAKLIGQYNLILYFVSKQPSELHDEIKKLRNLFPSQVIAIEVLSLEKLHKSIQFPMILLSRQRN